MTRRLTKFLFKRRSKMSRMLVANPVGDFTNGQLPVRQELVSVTEPVIEHPAVNRLAEYFPKAFF